VTKVKIDETISDFLTIGDDVFKTLANNNRRKALEVLSLEDLPNLNYKRN